MNNKRYNQVFRKNDDLYDTLKENLENGDDVPDIFEGFFVENGKLKAPDNRVVVPNRDISRVLQDEYENHEIHFLGKGIKNIHYYLNRKYINITRYDVYEFLRDKPEYQIQRSYANNEGKVVIAKKPNEVWGIDLVDMSGFHTVHQHKFILVVVDLFSRYTWARSLRNKTAVEVRNKFNQILQEATIHPLKVLSDLGTEFKEQFQQRLDELGIQHITTNSHSPKQNAIVERRNQELRKTLRAFAVKLNSKNWWGNIDLAVRTLNESYNSSIKKSPVELWQANHNAPIEIPKDIQKKTDRMTKLRQRERELQNGDMVRIKMSSLFSNYRKRIKEGFSKNMPVKWTPILFEIREIVQAR
eukprot:gene38262-46494_t